MLIVTADKLPEDGGAAFDIADVLFAGGGGRLFGIQDIQHFFGCFDAALHRQGYTGGKNRIEKRAGVTDEKITGTGDRPAAVTEIRQNLVGIGANRISHPMPNDGATRDRPGQDGVGWYVQRFGKFRAGDETDARFGFGQADQPEPTFLAHDDAGMTGFGAG